MMLDPEDVLPQLIKARARDFPERVFIEEVDGRSSTYSEVHASASRWANAFRRLGIEPGETVLVMMPTSLEAICAWLGLAWLRAVEVPVNTAYKGQMLTHIINDSQAKVIVASEAFIPRLEDIRGSLERLGTVICPDAVGEADSSFHVIDTDSFLDGASNRFSGPGPAYFDLSCIMYTSGTTGPSKGVMVPWAQLHAIAVGSMPVEGLDESDAYYAPFPMNHISGRQPLYLMAIINGRTVIAESFDTKRFWQDIGRYSCTSTMLLGAMANFIFRQDATSDDSRTPLDKVIMMPLIPETREFEQRFGTRVCTLFGMTETSIPIVSGWDPTNLEACGRERPGYEVRVVDDHDEEVMPGDVGELVVRADAPWVQMAGYWGMPEATVESWRNQWLHTGDLFRYDVDGWLYFVDRKKDAIRRRGENISSFEVESEVNSHPNVLESAAVAVPSEWGEDEVKIVVSPKANYEIDVGQLVQYLRERLPGFMVPRYIEVQETLPKTPTGKIRKVELRQVGVTGSTIDLENEVRNG